MNASSFAPSAARNSASLSASPTDSPSVSTNVNSGLRIPAPKNPRRCWIRHSVPAADSVPNLCSFKVATGYDGIPLRYRRITVEPTGATGIPPNGVVAIKNTARSDKMPTRPTTIRLSNYARAAIQKEADLAGISLNAWIVEAALGRVVYAKAIREDPDIQNWNQVQEIVSEMLRNS